MKNLSWAVLGLLLCVPFTGAETIDSVSFNPARLGRYETLKVSDQLTTKGGIDQCGSGAVRRDGVRQQCG